MVENKGRTIAVYLALYHFTLIATNNRHEPQLANIAMAAIYSQDLTGNLSDIIQSLP